MAYICISQFGNQLQQYMQPHKFFIKLRDQSITWFMENFKLSENSNKLNDKVSQTAVFIVPITIVCLFGKHCERSLY